ncbi:Uncharacterised protein [Streptococcus pneumoniae]|nr:Uncharacterised protein [Streptococcus pneumoniae]
MKISKPTIFLLLNRHNLFKNQIGLLFFLVHHRVKKKETIDNRNKNS